MYIARFSYDLLPVNRDAGLTFIRREVAGALSRGLNARMLIPLTRGEGGAALQLEVELTSLDQLETFRHQAGAPSGDTGELMREFSQIMLSPPKVEILRVDDTASG